MEIYICKLWTHLSQKLLLAQWVVTPPNASYIPSNIAAFHDLQSGIRIWFKLWLNMTSNFLLFFLWDLNMWRHNAHGQSDVEYGLQGTQEFTGKSELPTYSVNVSCVYRLKLAGYNIALCIFDEEIRGVSNWGYYANCCFWLLYVRSFELVLFFTFIIFMELGNNYLDVFMKLSYVGE